MNYIGPALESRQSWNEQLSDEEFFLLAFPKKKKNSFI